MQSTGIVRRLDKIGRIVIPKELRKSLEIKQNDLLEIFTDEEKIVLEKYHHDCYCMVTGEATTTPILLADGKITVSEKGLQLLKKELPSILANEQE